MPAREVLEEIGLNRRAVGRLRAEIAKLDGSSRRAYIRAFHREFSGPGSSSSFDDLVVACFKADLVYVGDFHALPSSQRFAARLLREIARRSRRSVLAVEMVFGRHQRILDQWLQGLLSEPEFLKRIRYEQDWGYNWESFREIFAVARENSIPTFGIDCSPRNGMRYVRERDRYMASRIADIFARSPEAKVIVMVGESHLATPHLPAAVREALARVNMERRSVRVLQNLEETWWDLVSQGQEHSDTVEVGRNVYCVFNSSPIEKYEAWRRTLDRWNQDRPEDVDPDLTPTVHNMIDTILKFLGVSKYGRAVTEPREEPPVRAGGRYIVDDYPEVYSAAELPALKRLLRKQKISRSEITHITAHVGRNGSCYIPAINAVYVGTFNLIHAGEEAAHFVNHALRGDIAATPRGPGARADSFYESVIEEALGFFGSKVIDPSRNHFFETKFYRYYRKSREIVERETGHSYEEFCEIIDFILLHKKFERSYEDYDEIPAPLLAGIRTRDRRRFNILTHELGYYLGQQIYDGYHAGIIGRKEVAGLFRRRFEGQGKALELYLDLSARLPGGISRDRK